MYQDLATEYWHSLQDQQLSWAFSAYDRLVKTLSEDVQERLQLKETVAEPYIVVFGKTQVGKTTLLLDLMGIEQANATKISKVLRGGREAGKSATATTMEYCRSSSDRWGLSRPGKEQEWLERDEDMSHALKMLRIDMEKGCLVADSPCVVHIPKSYFVNSATFPSVRMLDLPGDNPANEQEQQHVYQMAKIYLPFADLILLVGKGDDLGFLKPSGISLPGIEDWQSMPYRFRIVTTYSYYSQSVKDILRKEPDVDTSRVRQRLIDQIEHFGELSEAAKHSNLYFPLEFGNSWMHTQASEPQLYSRMAPIIAELRAELLAQISSSTTPMGRLRSTLNTHISVKYIQKKKTERINDSIATLELKEKTADSDLKLWKTKVESEQLSFTEISALIDSNPGKRCTLDIQKKIQALLSKPPNQYTPKEGSAKNDCKKLNAMVRQYYLELKKMKVDINGQNCQALYWRCVRDAFEKPKPDIIEDILDDSFELIRSRINDYWFDTYVNFSNYQTDLKSVRDAGRVALVRLSELWQRQWLAAISCANNVVRQRLDRARTRLALFQEERDAAIARHAVIKQAIVDHEKERKRIEENSKEDIERCERFVHLLEEEYAAALDEQYAAALQEKDDSDALLQLLSCIAMTNQYEEFLAFNEQQTSQYLA